MHQRAFMHAFGLEFELLDVNKYNLLRGAFTMVSLIDLRLSDLKIDQLGYRHLHLSGNICYYKFETKWVKI